MNDDEKTALFMARINPGIDYARARWSNADDVLVIQQVYELGEALLTQGLDGANETAAQLEQRFPALQRN